MRRDQMGRSRGRSIALWTWRLFEHAQLMDRHRESFWDLMKATGGKQQVLHARQHARDAGATRPLIR
jgi:hypothetical protein